MLLEELLKAKALQRCCPLIDEKDKKGKTRFSWEQHSEYYLLPFRLDGCSKAEELLGLKERQKCDYIVAWLSPESDRIIFLLIELKGKNIDKAKKQLRETYRAMKEKDIHDYEYLAIIVADRTGNMKKPFSIKKLEGIPLIIFPRRKGTFKEAKNALFR